jgi:fido (protein-threonine AMPylation protein)
MGEIYSEFLDELLQNIRARPISWEAQQRSGVIDDADVCMVKSIDKQRRDKRSEIVAKVIAHKESELMTGSWEICPVDCVLD